MILQRAPSGEKKSSLEIILDELVTSIISINVVLGSEEKRRLREVIRNSKHPEFHDILN
ncbi:hypothetical protein FACS189461_1350 [Spirochaetia bacterium]|nr:hypothetical protein FACS189461_1350 [Spirochaetia bacterium]